MDLLFSSALCFLGAGSASGILVTGLLYSHGLSGDLIGDSGATLLAAMSAKMAAISVLDTEMCHGRVLSRTVCQALLLFVKLCVLVTHSDCVHAFNF